MSKGNVEAFKRAVDAYNRRDINAFIDEFDPALEWRPLTQLMFGRDLTVYRGHEGIRQFMRDVDEVLAEVRIECSEIQDLGDRIVVMRAASCPWQGKRCGNRVADRLGGRFQ